MKKGKETRQHLIECAAELFYKTKGSFYFKSLIFITTLSADFHTSHIFLCHRIGFSKQSRKRKKAADMLSSNASTASILL